MKSYASNEAFFQAVNSLAQECDRSNLPQVSLELRQGLTFLNGLTDGWALLLDALIRAKAFESQLSADQRVDLNSMISAAQKVVYR